MKSCRKGQFAFETLWPLVKSLQGILTASPLLGNDLEEEWHKVVMAPPSLASFSLLVVVRKENLYYWQMLVFLLLFTKRIPFQGM